MRLIDTVLAAPLIAACVFIQFAVAETSADNPYAKTYVSQKQVAAKVEPGQAKIYVGKDKVGDYQRQLEKGYDILGYSSFSAGEVSPDKLAAQAAVINADVALVYTQVSGRAPASVRLDKAKAAAMAKEAGDTAVKPDQPKDVPAAVLYSYFASYWTKLPPPILGVHVQGKVETASGETGLQVLAVIEGSPAAATLRREDTLLRLGEIPLDKPEALMQAAQRYAGQTVDVVFERGGEKMSKSLSLGVAR